MARTALERQRGCKESSKIYPIADEVRADYESGLSFLAIAIKFAHLGITKGMVAGHVTRNKIVRTGGGKVADQEVRVLSERLQKRADEKALSSPPSPTRAAQVRQIAEVAQAIISAPSETIPQPTNVVSMEEVERRRAAAQKFLEFRKTKQAAEASKIALLQRYPEIKGAKTILNQKGGCWFHVGPTPDTPANQLFCSQPQEPGKLFCEFHGEHQVKSIRKR